MIRSVRGLVLSAGIAAIAIVLCGCAVDQNKEVAIYRKVLDGDPATAPSNDFAPGAPLNLLRAMELSDLRNENLDINGENYLQSLINKDLAYANFLPTVSAGPSFGISQRGSANNRGDGGLLTGNVGKGSFTHSFNVPISANYNVFNGFSDVSNLRRTEANIVRFRSLLIDAQQTLYLNVAQAFYNVLRAERSVVVLENSLQVQEERIRDIRAKQRVGVARPLDVAQTEAEAAAARVSLVSAITDVSNTRNVLAFLLNAPSFTSPLQDTLNPPAAPPTLDDALMSAEKYRQDLQAARAAVVAARQQVEVEFGAYYPSVSLNLNHYLYKQSAPTDADLSGILSANIPIFTAGIINARVRLAWSEFRQARFTELNLERQIDQDIKISLENFISAGKTLDELRTELRAAEDAFRQAEQSYNVGLATNLERLTAQDTLLSTQLQFTTQEFTVKVNYLNLLRTMGRLQRESLHDLPMTTQPTTIIPLTTTLRPPVATQPIRVPPLPSEQPPTTQRIMSPDLPPMSTTDSAPATRPFVP